MRWVLSAVMIVALWASAVGAQEPRYQGRTMKQWADQLRSRDEADKEAAAKAFIHFGARAVPLLTSMLRDPDVEARKGAGGALWMIGPTAKDALPDLMWIAERDPDEHMRMGGATFVFWLATARPQVPPTESVPIFAQAIQDPDPMRRHGGMRGLITVVQASDGRLEPSVAGQAVAGLVSTLRAPDAALRRDAVACLGMIGAPASAAIPELRRIARDDADNRHQAETALRSIKDR
jgi:HEAT repeat protein